MSTLCSECLDALPLVVVVDLTELEHALMFGDAPSRQALCATCLAASSAEGAWDHIEVLGP